MVPGPSNGRVVRRTAGYVLELELSGSLDADILLELGASQVSAVLLPS